MENNMSNELLFNMVQTSPNPMACVRIIEQGDDKCANFVMLNDEFKELYGIDAETILDNVFSLKDLAEFNQNDPISMAILDVFNKQSVIERDIELVNMNRTYKLKAIPLLNEYISIVLSDVTEYNHARKEAISAAKDASSSGAKLKYQVDLLKATTEKMEDTNRIHKVVAESASDSFYYKSYSQGTFFATDSWYRLFTIDGKKPVDNQNMIEGISDFDVFNFSRLREKNIMDKVEFSTMEFRLSDNATWIEANYRFIYDESGKLSEEVAFFKDITLLKRQKEELAYKAYYDDMTGLMNRRFFTEELERDIKRAESEDATIAILYVDLDDFKDVNDILGFKMADEFILKFSMLIKKFQDANIKIGRFDSDEFVISMYDSSRFAAKNLAAEIRKLLAQPLVLANGLTQRITVSIGISQYPESGKKAVEIISNADIALSNAKKNGKNRVVIFDSEMLEQFMVKMEMEKTIKNAIVCENFVLYYQPQYYTNSKKMRGVEALIRMRDEVLGFVSPNEFIPIAEHNGTIVDIGEWVLRKAFEDYCSWRDAYGFDGVLSVNISPIQFKQVVFESTLYKLIKEYKIDSSKVEIEITESVFMDNKFQLTEMLKRIRNNGIKVSLDDFGTGYSSLSYLQNIPIDTLKIDKSFIDNLGEKENTDIITGYLIEMARKLGVEIVAEGVETQSQFEFLKRMNCDNIQGYYLAKPMTADAIRMVIREEKC